MNTFTKLWTDVFTPEQARLRIEEEKKMSFVEDPQTLEEQAINLVGKTIFEKLVKGYTEKQWGKQCNQLPAFIIKRLPVRFTFDNNYFNDKYQGIPVGGYTQIIDKMLKNVEVRLNCDYFDNRIELDELADNIIYTGPIDKFFDYCYGPLEYRSVRFDTEILDVENYQGNAVVNYTDYETPYTRIIEHKHFEFGKQPKTIISKEYSSLWKLGDEPYYPVNDEKNNQLYKKYEQLTQEHPNVIFGGRLGKYKYYDMHVVVKEALACVEEICR
jgi:UDP-galactopyranose mutase